MEKKFPDFSLTFCSFSLTIYRCYRQSAKTKMMFLCYGVPSAAIVTFWDCICGSGGLIDSSPALGVVYEVSVWSPW